VRLVFDEIQHKKPELDHCTPSPFNSRTDLNQKIMYEPYQETSKRVSNPMTPTHVHYDPVSNLVCGLKEMSMDETGIV